MIKMNLTPHQFDSLFEESETFRAIVRTKMEALGNPSNVVPISEVKREIRRRFIDVNGRLDKIRAIKWLRTYCRDNGSMGLEVNASGPSTGIVTLAAAKRFVESV